MSINTPKLTASLATRLQDASDSDVIEVIVELEPLGEGAMHAAPDATEPLSRQQKVAARQAAFQHHVQPVVTTIQQAGGEVTGQAWINGTVRAKVPAGGLLRLASLDTIAALDVPHPLKADVG